MQIKHFKSLSEQKSISVGSAKMEGLGVLHQTRVGGQKVREQMKELICSAVA